MGKETTLEERIKMIEMFQNGYPDKEISEQFQVSIHTVRKWRYRFATQGRKGLFSPRGCPPTGSLSRFPVELEKTLHAWREEHGGWGAKTLLAELKRHPYWKEKPLPSRATINRWLKEKQLTRPYHPHSDLPEINIEEQPSDAHQEWEMDARGYQYIPHVGVISLINLNDCFTHIRLLSYPCWLGHKRRQRHPNTEDYQVALRLAFMRWGLPEQLSVDHESVFYDNDQSSPFPTRLHRWLITLGVRLCFGRKGFAVDQAITERSHQLWYHQVIEGQSFDRMDQLFAVLQRRREFLNHHLPCAALDEKPPLVVYPEAMVPKHPYHPQRERELMDINRLYQYLAKGRWFRKVSKDGTFSLGSYVYYLHKSWARHQIEITFDHQTNQFICKNEDVTKIKSLAPKGCSKDDLIGEAGEFTKLSSVQLHLPFSYEEWRQLQIL